MSAKITAGHYFVPNYITKLFQELTLVRLPDFGGFLAIMRKGSLSESAGGGGSCLIQFVDAGADLNAAFPIMQNRGKTRSGWGVANLFKKSTESVNVVKVEDFLEYLEHHFEWEGDNLQWDLPTELLDSIAWSGKSGAVGLHESDFQLLKSIIEMGYGLSVESEVFEVKEENELKTQDEHEIEQIIEEVLESNKSAEWGSW